MRLATPAPVRSALLRVHLYKQQNQQLTALLFTPTQFTGEGRERLTGVQVSHLPGHLDEVSCAGEGRLAPLVRRAELQAWHTLKWLTYITSLTGCFRYL